MKEQSYDWPQDDENKTWDLLNSILYGEPADHDLYIHKDYRQFKQKLVNHYVRAIDAFRGRWVNHTAGALKEVYNQIAEAKKNTSQNITWTDAALMCDELQLEDEH